MSINFQLKKSNFNNPPSGFRIFKAPEELIQLSPIFPLLSQLLLANSSLLRESGPALLTLSPWVLRKMSLFLWGLHWRLRWWMVSESVSASGLALNTLLNLWSRKHPAMGSKNLLNRKKLWHRHWQSLSSLYPVESPLHPLNSSFLTRLDPQQQDRLRPRGKQEPLLPFP